MRISLVKWVVGGVLLAAAQGCSTTTTEERPPEHREYSKTEKARMLVEIANGSLVEGDTIGALQSLARAEEQDDSLPELYHSRAIAYYRKNDLTSAIEAASRAVEIKENYSDANNTLGKLYMEVGKNTEAEKYLKRAASDALYREAYKAQTNLGILKYRAGQYSEAKLALDRAIHESPSLSCVAHYYRGNIHLKANHLKEAVEDYSAATKKVCADFSDAYLALGIAYQQDKQFGLARKMFLEVQKRYPNTKLAEQAMDQLRFLP